MLSLALLCSILLKCLFVTASFVAGWKYSVFTNADLFSNSFFIFNQYLSWIMIFSLPNRGKFLTLCKCDHTNAPVYLFTICIFLCILILPGPLDFNLPMNPCQCVNPCVCPKNYQKLLMCLVGFSHNPLCMHMFSSTC